MKTRALVWLGIAVLVLETALGRISAPIRILDTRLYYSVPEALRLIDALGEAGRAIYWKVVVVDLVFIPVYATFLIGVLSRLFPEGERRWTMAAPIGMAVFDLLETIGIGLLLRQYPESSQSLARVVSVCTPLKWLFFAVILAAVLIRQILDRFARQFVD